MEILRSETQEMHVQHRVSSVFAIWLVVAWDCTPVVVQGDNPNSLLTRYGNTHEFSHAFIDNFGAPPPGAIRENKRAQGAPI